MNKTNLLVFLGTSLFCVFSVFASIPTQISNSNGYDLEMKLSLNGKTITAPHIKTLAGETTTFTEKTGEVENFIEVTAIDGSILGNEGIMMTFVVGTIDKDGNRMIVSKPGVFAKNNKKSEMAFENESTNEMLSLSVVAKRKTL